MHVSFTCYSESEAFQVNSENNYSMLTAIISISKLFYLFKTFILYGRSPYIKLWMTPNQQLNQHKTILNY